MVVFQLVISAISKLRILCTDVLVIDHSQPWCWAGLRAALGRLDLSSLPVLLFRHHG